MRRALLICCALAYGQDQTCVDDPNWVKNGDEPWKDCAWVAEFIPTRCAVRGADGRDGEDAVAAIHMERIASSLSAGR